MIHPPPPTPAAGGKGGGMRIGERGGPVSLNTRWGSAQVAERPDKRRQRDLRHQWESQQRAAARAKFPLPNDRLRALFVYLWAEFTARGCDHSLRLTEEWLNIQGLPAEPVISWLQENGGYCDCEAAGNAREAWESANKDVDW